MGFTVRNIAFSLLIFSATSAFSFEAKATPEADAYVFPRIDFVIDLDYTALSPITVEQAKREPWNAFVHEGNWFRISDGTARSLNLIRRFRHVHLSIFSGGKKVRNEMALKAIILDRSSGLTAFDVMEKILNFEDLKDLTQNPTSSASLGDQPKFKDRYRKDLKDHFPDMERTILLDDVKEFATEDQKKNLLWIGPTYDFYREFDDIPASAREGPHAIYTPPNRLAWEIERNRVPIAFLILESAILDEMNDPRPNRIPFTTRVIEKARTPKETLLKLWKIRNPIPEIPCIATVRATGA